MEKRCRVQTATRFLQPLNLTGSLPPQNQAFFQDIRTTIPVSVVIDRRFTVEIVR
jgi:hypothetical protein